MGLWSLSVLHGTSWAICWNSVGHAHWHLRGLTNMSSMLQLIASGHRSLSCFGISLSTTGCHISVSLFQALGWIIFFFWWIHFMKTSAVVYFLDTLWLHGKYALEFGSPYLSFLFPHSITLPSAYATWAGMPTLKIICVSPKHHLNPFILSHLLKLV